MTLSSRWSTPPEPVVVDMTEQEIIKIIGEEMSLDLNWRLHYDVAERARPRLRQLELKLAARLARRGGPFLPENSRLNERFVGVMQRRLECDEIISRGPHRPWREKS